MDRNKEIQKLRIMSYFVRATNKIIETEGIDSVTVRKVANMAGYNPATLYNYFENIDYLVGFASIKYLNEYHKSLLDEVEKVEDPLERFLKVWEKFCFFSFRKPKIYRAIFFTTPNFTVCELFEYYFKMFPEELGGHADDIQRMMKGCTIHARNLSILRDLRDKAYKDISNDVMMDSNDMMITIYRGFLTEVIEDVKTEHDLDKKTKLMLDYIKLILSTWK